MSCSPESLPPGWEVTTTTFPETQPPEWEDAIASSPESLPPGFENPIPQPTPPPPQQNPPVSQPSPLAPPPREIQSNPRSPPPLPECQCHHPPSSLKPLQETQASLPHQQENLDAVLHPPPQGNLGSLHPPPLRHLSEMGQMVCGNCNELLSYPRGTKYIQCACCQTVNFVLEAHQVGIVKCGKCAVLLMYPYGAKSLRCSSCHSVTEIGLTYGWSYGNPLVHSIMYAGNPLIETTTKLLSKAPQPPTARFCAARVPCSTSKCCTFVEGMLILLLIFCYCVLRKNDFAVSYSSDPHMEHKRNQQYEDVNGSLYK